jgi:hypothetical protein
VVQGPGCKRPLDASPPRAHLGFQGSRLPRAGLRPAPRTSGRAGGSARAAKAGGMAVRHGCTMCVCVGVLHPSPVAPRDQRALQQLPGVAPCISALTGCSPVSRLSITRSTIAPRGIYGGEQRRHNQNGGSGMARMLTCWAIGVNTATCWRLTSKAGYPRSVSKASQSPWLPRRRRLQCNPR